MTQTMHRMYSTQVLPMVWEVTGILWKMIEQTFITTSETDMCTGNIKAFQTVVWQAHRKVKGQHLSERRTPFG